jgi:hypothetical protein
MTTWRADPEAITRALGGDWHGTYGRAPGPGHSRKDRSLKISAHPTDPNDVILHSFAGDEWMPVKDDLRRLGLLPEWRPGARDEAPHSRPKTNGYVNGATGKTTAEPKPPAPRAETKARLERQGYREVAPPSASTRARRSAGARGRRLMHPQKQIRRAVVTPARPIKIHNGTRSLARSAVECKTGVAILHIEGAGDVHKQTAWAH